jgi:hypothetical protein
MIDADELVNRDGFIGSAREKIRRFFPCDDLPGWARNAVVKLFETGARLEFDEYSGSCDSGPSEDDVVQTNVS